MSISRMKILILVAILSFTHGKDGVKIDDLIPMDYDLTQGPFHPDEPTIIRIGWKVKGIFDVNVHDMTILLSMYFRISWRDYRLTIPSSFEEGQIVPLHASILEKIWLPDIYIHETVNVNSLSMIQEVEGVSLRDNQTIFFSSFLKARIACPMYFSKYPFDVQTCHMTVSSYVFDEEHFKLEWLSSGISAESQVDSQLPNYNFKIISDDITSKHWCVNTTTCSFAPSSMGKAQMIFQRRYVGHILSLYLPSALVVSLAWVSFFWPADSVPGRTVLIITSLLTIISMYGAVGQRSPETSYLKAVDVWLFMCIVHVSLALFQFAVIITIRKQQKDRTINQNQIFPKDSMMLRLPPLGGPKSCTNCQSQSDISSTSMGSSDTSLAASAYKKGTASASLRLTLQEQWVEKAGRFGLPLLFLVCCLLYWPFYLT